MKYQLVEESSCPFRGMTQAKNFSSYFIMKDCQYINLHLGDAGGNAGFACVRGMHANFQRSEATVFLNLVRSYLEIQYAESALGDFSLFLNLSVYIAWTPRDRNLSFSYADLYSPQFQPRWTLFVEWLDISNSCPFWDVGSTNELASGLQPLPASLGAFCGLGVEYFPASRILLLSPLLLIFLFLWVKALINISVHLIQLCYLEVLLIFNGKYLDKGNLF